jgi:hypothetical protein
MGFDEAKLDSGTLLSGKDQKANYALELGAEAHQRLDYIVGETGYNTHNYHLSVRACFVR